MSRPLPRQAILVVNAMSRKGADAFAEARERLEAAGVELIDAIAVDDPAKMDATVIDAVARAPMVIVFIEGVEVARQAGNLLATTVNRALGSPEEPADNGTD